jgi:hypothetical protein
MTTSILASRMKRSPGRRVLIVALFAAAAALFFI